MKNRVTLYIAVALVIMMRSSVADAGGTSVPVQFLDLSSIGDDRYVLKFKTLDGPEYQYETYPLNTVITVNLHYDGKRYVGKHEDLTLENYKAAVKLLATYCNAKKVDRFRKLGGGLCKNNRSLNTFESDALAIEEEEGYITEGRAVKKNQRMVVYSVCKYH